MKALFLQVQKPGSHLLNSKDYSKSINHLAPVAAAPVYWFIH